MGLLTIMMCLVVIWVLSHIGVGQLLRVEGGDYMNNVLLRSILLA